MKKLALLLLFISLPSFGLVRVDLTKPSGHDLATIYPSYKELIISNFIDTGGRMAGFGLKKNKTDKVPSIMYVASIGSSKAGMQRIYIYLPDKCVEKKLLRDDVILRVGHQNVKFNQFCQSNNHEVYLSPKTRAGENFIVHQFVTKKYVSFYFPEITVVFDATGFKKSWDNFGGDAL